MSTKHDTKVTKNILNYQKIYHLSQCSRYEVILGKYVSYFSMKTYVFAPIRSASPRQF